MAFTSRANRANYAIGFAPQTAKGSAASSAAARMIAAESVATDAGRESIHPQGSTGSLHNKDTFRHVVTSPKITATILGAREFLGPLLEMATFGKPTVSNAQLTETLDTGNVLSSWALVGVRPGFNTAYSAAGVCALYVKIETNVIKLYKDAAFANLVAQGNAAADTVTLTAQNNSGLSGTVVCSTATPTNDLDILLTINTISMAYATTPQVYWTCFIDDGKKLRTYADCVLRRISGKSENAGPLTLEVEIWAMSQTIGATALTPSIAAENVYAHNGDLAMRNALDTTPVTQDPTSVTWTFERDLKALVGTAAVPQDFYSGLIRATLEASFEPTAELDTVLALVDTFESLDVKYTNSSKLFAITLDKATLVNPNYPGFNGDDVASVDLEWIATEETAASPSAAITLTYQP